MRTLSLSLLFAVAACGDANGPPALQPASFALIEGAAQVDTVGRELKDMIALRVIATDGAQSVPNYPITWTTPDGGSVFATVVYSGSDGIARQRWTLGTRAGTQRLVARALDGETGEVLVDDTVTAEGLATWAVNLYVMPNYAPTNPVSVGDTVEVRVFYWDPYQNIRAPCRDGTAWDAMTWVFDSTVVQHVGYRVDTEHFSEPVPMARFAATASGTTGFQGTTLCALPGARTASVAGNEQVTVQ